MIYKRAEECNVIDLKAADEECIFNLFKKYGDYATVIVCDDKCLVGIITYGQWVSNIDDEGKWINKECRTLRNDNYENILIAANEIFASNEKVRALPITNDKREFIGCIEKENIQVEKEVIDTKWDRFSSLFKDEELKTEIDMMRKFLANQNCAIIGKNYLTMEFCCKTGIEPHKILIDSGCLCDSPFDYVIDMDVRFSRVRKKVYGQDYDSIFSFPELLDELYKLAMEESFTKWECCLNGEYSNLDSFFKIFSVGDIILKKKSLITHLVGRYLQKHKYEFVYKNINTEYLIGADLGAGFVNQINFHPIEKYIFCEEQLVHMNLEWIKQEKKDIRILNFYMPRSLVLNKKESKRFLLGNGFFNLETINEDELSDFFGLPFRGKEWVKKLTDGREKRVNGRGLIKINNMSGGGVSYQNSIRYTAHVPDKYLNSIYFFGPCIAAGFLSEDKDTIESLLQEEINRLRLPYRVVNLGNSNPENIEKYFQSIDFEDGDVIVAILYAPSKKTIENIEAVSLQDAFDCIDKNAITCFWDITAHCNMIANKCMADYMLPYLLPVLKDNTFGGKWKDHSIYTLFNNDKDIQYLERDIYRYITQLKKSICMKEPSGSNNGAIIMNANPFSKGHLYLVEESALKCETLYLFVVEEDKSFYSFKDRFLMVKEGVKHLKNVIVLPSGRFILSSFTLPGYFVRESLRGRGEVIVSECVDCSFDARIFGKFIAPQFNIKTRFFGDEPIDAITDNYVKTMELVLKQYGVKVSITKRKLQENGELISASYIRKAIHERNWKLVEALAPESTVKHLKTITFMEHSDNSD